MEPVQNRFAFKGFVEFPALLDRCLFHGSFLSLFTRFSVRQFEVPSNREDVAQGGGDELRILANQQF
jgi:hypothetical protein